MNRLGGAGAAALAILALAGLTGCHENPSADAAVPGVPVPSSTAPGTAGGSGPAGEPAGRSCRSADLLANLYFERAHDQLVNSVLILTDRTNRTCTIDGSATFALFDTARKPADVATVVRTFPRAGRPVTLRAGFSAYSGVQWRADPTCAPAGALGVYAPQDSPGTAQNVRVMNFGDKAATVARLRICDGRITVGTLQPSSQGVTFP